MEKPYKYKKKLVKSGGSWYFIIPAEWLKKQSQRLNKKIIETMDLLIYDDYLEIRATKN